MTTGGVTTTSTWDVNAGLAQELYDGSLSYVYGIGRIAQIDGSGNTYYYLPDALGSTMALCDASGNVVDSYNYDAFGAIRSSTGSQANPFTFTGEQTDASTGLEYLRARYYDAASGSFISRDAMPGLNRFAYGGGNPVGNVDPSGLLCYSQEAYDKIAGEMSPLGGAVAEQWDKNKQQILAAMSQAGICGGDGSIQ